LQGIEQHLNLTINNLNLQLAEREATVQKLNKRLTTFDEIEAALKEEISG
jgi:uncharacterized coiled-coil protein SlyX